MVLPLVDSNYTDCLTTTYESLWWKNFPFLKKGIEAQGQEKYLKLDKNKDWIKWLIQIILKTMFTFEYYNNLIKINFDLTICAEEN